MTAQTETAAGQVRVLNAVRECVSRWNDCRSPLEAQNAMHVIASAYARIGDEGEQTTAKCSGGPLDGELKKITGTEFYTLTLSDGLRNIKHTYTLQRFSSGEFYYAWEPNKDWKPRPAGAKTP